MLKGGWHEKFLIFLLAIFEPWVELYSQFFGDFLLYNFFCRKRGQFPLIIASAFAPSGCGVGRARFRLDVRKGTLNGSLSVEREGLATVSNGSSDSMDLSLSFSVSSVESEEYEASEVEGDLETVEAYQFEPEVSDHSPGERFEDTAEAGDDDSGDKERLHSRD